MKLTDLVWNIWTYLTADRKRLQFMDQLMKLSEKDPQINELLQKKTIECEQNGKDPTAYLEELYDFWITGKDLMTKISRDIQMDES